jgi:4-hydroxy-3-methylbut-2-enyl diphosphate reductase
MRARRDDRLAMLAARDGMVALAGFAGGLDPARRAGDVVVATEICHAGGRVPLPAGTDLLAQLQASGVPAVGGPLWCSATIVRGRQRAELAETGAVAVDMESAPVVDACGPERLVVVRVVVDTPARGLFLGCLLGGRRSWRALRAVGTSLRAMRAVGTSLRALRAVGTSLRALRAVETVPRAVGTAPRAVESARWAAPPGRMNWPARDDSITSGTVRSGGTPQRQAD